MDVVHASFKAFSKEGYCHQERKKGNADTRAVKKDTGPAANLVITSTHLATEGPPLLLEEDEQVLCTIQSLNNIRSRESCLALWRKAARQERRFLSSLISWQAEDRKT